jgi:hypothetical protein
MEHFCKLCNKKYASYKSLWFHNYKFHKDDSLKKPQKTSKIDTEKSEVPQNPSKIEEEKIDSELNCKYCNKIFTRKDNLSRHLNKCKEKNNAEEIENIVTEKVNSIVANQIQQFMKSIKIHPKTLQKINNQLNNCNNNNTIINNTIISVSDQNLKNVLNKNEKMAVLNSGSKAHLKLTDIIYKNPEYEKFRDVYITNLSNDIGYIFNKKDNRFIVKSKKDILDDYGVERFSDIQYFYEELENKIDSVKLAKLKKMVTAYFKDNEFKDAKNKEILIELYNNRVQVQKIYDTVNKNIKEIEL